MKDHFVQLYVTVGDASARGETSAPAVSVVIQAAGKAANEPIHSLKHLFMFYSNNRIEIAIRDSTGKKVYGKEVICRNPA